MKQCNRASDIRTYNIRTDNIGARGIEHARSIIIPLAFCSGLSLGNSVALAANTTASTDIRDLLNLSLEELGQVKVTTATLTDETLQSVPSSVTVYTRKDIRELGVARLEDLLNFVPGFQSYVPDEVSHIHAYSSRGRRTGTSGREVLVLLDGHRINSDFNGGMEGGTVVPSLENVERVEIIRGAGSAIYGSNAMLGVINIITRSGREASINAGSNHQREASGQWQAGGTDLGIDVFARDGRNDGQALTEQDPLTHQHINTRDPYHEQELYLRGNAGEWNVAARWTQVDASGKYVLGYADNPVRPNNTWQHDYFVDAGWQHHLDNGLQLDSHWYVLDKTYKPSAMMMPTPRVFISVPIREREAGWRGTLQGQAGSSQWLAGAEYRQPDLYNGAGTVDIPAMNSSRQQQYYEEGRHDISGLFGQYQYHFNDIQTDLTAGLRYDHDSDSGESFSPRLGLIHPLDSANTVKLLYSEAFRAPSPTETRISSPAIVSNPALKPETAKTTELVWMHNGPANFTSATLFNTDIRDGITEIPLGTARSYTNTPMHINGIELEWHHQLGDNWLLRSTATRIVHSSVAINSEASQLFSAALTYRGSDWTATLAAHGSNERQDSVDTDNNPATTEYHNIGGRTLLSGHVSWQAATQLELYLHADNLLDKQYFSPATRYQNTEGAPERGRALTAGARWRF